MISKSLERAINAQIATEIWSANIYLAMSFYCDKEGYEGFAQWMKKQSQEEMEHASLMAAFIIKRGGTAEVGSIQAVEQTWDSPLSMFEVAYSHECFISKKIDELLEMAIEEKDYAAQDFFWSFVREQVEEEDQASHILDRIKKMGDTALFNLDQQYGARQ